MDGFAIKYVHLCQSGFKLVCINSEIIVMPITESLQTHT